MSELNKHVLLAMKLLDDKGSVSQDELIENRKAADAAADAAAAAAYATADAYAGKWVYKYFERTGENKQDYIDAIEAGKVSSKKEPIQEWVDGLPPVGCECFVEYPYDDGCFKPFHGKKVTILGYCSDSDGESVFTAHGSNGFIALYANGFRPLKTQEQKDREAFIEWANKATNADGKDHTVVDLFNDLFDAGFKAPEGE